MPAADVSSRAARAIPVAGATPAGQAALDGTARFPDAPKRFVDWQQHSINVNLNTIHEPCGVPTRAPLPGTLFEKLILYAFRAVGGTVGIKDCALAAPIPATKALLLCSKLAANVTPAAWCRIEPTSFASLVAAALTAARADLRKAGATLLRAALSSIASGDLPSDSIVDALRAHGLGLILAERAISTSDNSAERTDFADFFGCVVALETEARSQQPHEIIVDAASALDSISGAIRCQTTSVPQIFGKYLLPRGFFEVASASRALKAALNAQDHAAQSLAWSQLADALHFAGGTKCFLSPFLIDAGGVLGALESALLPASQSITGDLGSVALHAAERLSALAASLACVNKESGATGVNISTALGAAVAALVDGALTSTPSIQEGEVLIGHQSHDAQSLETVHNEGGDVLFSVRASQTHPSASFSDHSVMSTTVMPRALSGVLAALTGSHTDVGAVNDWGNGFSFPSLMLPSNIAPVLSAAGRGVGLASAPSRTSSLPPVTVSLQLIPHSSDPVAALLGLAPLGATRSEAGKEGVALSDEGLLTLHGRYPDGSLFSSTVPPTVSVPLLSTLADVSTMLFNRVSADLCALRTAVKKSSESAARAAAASEQSKPSLSTRASHSSSESGASEAKCPLCSGNKSRLFSPMALASHADAPHGPHAHSLSTTVICPFCRTSVSCAPTRGNLGAAFATHLRHDSSCRSQRAAAPAVAETRTDSDRMPPVVSSRASSSEDSSPRVISPRATIGVIDSVRGAAQSSQRNQFSDFADDAEEEDDYYDDDGEEDRGSEGRDDEQVELDAALQAALDAEAGIGADGASGEATVSRTSAPRQQPVAVLNGHGVIEAMVTVDDRARSSAMGAMSARAAGAEIDRRRAAVASIAGAAWRPSLPRPPTVSPDDTLVDTARGLEAWASACSSARASMIRSMPGSIRQALLLTSGLALEDSGVMSVTEMAAVSTRQTCEYPRSTWIQRESGASVPDRQNLLDRHVPLPLDPLLLRRLDAAALPSSQEHERGTVAAPSVGVAHASVGTSRDLFYADNVNGFAPWVTPRSTPYQAASIFSAMLQRNSRTARTAALSSLRSIDEMDAPPTIVPSPRGGGLPSTASSRSGMQIAPDGRPVLQSSALEERRSRPTHGGRPVHHGTIQRAPETPEQRIHTPMTPSTPNESLSATVMPGFIPFGSAVEMSASSGDPHSGARRRRRSRRTAASALGEGSSLIASNSSNSNTGGSSALSSSSKEEALGRVAYLESLSAALAKVAVRGVWIVVTPQAPSTLAAPVIWGAGLFDGWTLLERAGVSLLNGGGDNFSRPFSLTWGTLGPHAAQRPPRGAILLLPGGRSLKIAEDDADTALGGLLHATHGRRLSCGGPSPPVPAGGIAPLPEVSNPLAAALAGCIQTALFRNQRSGFLDSTAPSALRAVALSAVLAAGSAQAASSGIERGAVAAMSGAVEVLALARSAGSVSRAAFASMTAVTSTRTARAVHASALAAAAGFDGMQRLPLIARLAIAAPSLIPASARESYAMAVGFGITRAVQTASEDADDQGRPRPARTNTLRDDDADDAAYSSSSTMGVPHMLTSVLRITGATSRFLPPHSGGKLLLNVPVRERKRLSVSRTRLASTAQRMFLWNGGSGKIAGKIGGDAASSIDHFSRALRRVAFSAAELGALHDDEASDADLRAGIRWETMQVQFQGPVGAMREGGGGHAAAAAAAGEAGHGLGPSAEFYTLACRDFCTRESGHVARVPKDSGALWHGLDSSDESITTPDSLHPSASLLTSSDHTVFRALSKFETLGALVGKALVDSRPLDMPLSNAFLGALRGDVLAPREALASFDAVLARSLDRLRAMAAHRNALLAKNDFDGAAAASAEIDALTLEWTMPGSGAAIDRHLAPTTLTLADSARVDADSLGAYITAVTKILLSDGVASAADAFLRGLEAFSPAPTLMLSLLEPHEWQEVICGGAAITDEETWSFPALRAALRPGPRYTSSSVQLDWLSTAISRLTVPRKKLFLRFVSGAPRVPAGGLRLSVTAVDAANVDTLLPSCATCTLTLKLPRYSSLEVLEAKLLVAITEGQEAFALD